MYIAYSRDKIAKDVGNTAQLFVDNDVIAMVKNVTRRLHSPTKHPENPLMVKDAPWEGIPYFRNSTFNVLRDPADGLYKCWYEDFFDYFGIGKRNIFQGSRILHAQSSDGLSWEKRPLGLFTVDGNDTNIVVDQEPDRMYSCPSVLLDEQESDPSRRYKMAYFRRIRDSNVPKRNPFGRHNGGLHMDFSPDGVNWTPYEGNPVFPSWGSDVEILTYDPVDGKYVLYGRYGGQGGSSFHPDFDGWFAPVSPSQPEGVWDTRRRIYRTESRDCLNWSEPVLAFSPGDDDNIDDGLYGFVPWRAGDIHLGLLNVLHAVDNTVEMYLLHSRNGQDWKRFQEHRPFISRGGPGTYDEFDVETPTQPLVVGDEMWFYYGGNSVHHDWWISGQGEGLDAPEIRDPSLSANGHHLCLATMRLDGYVSLGATLREGYVDTKPVFSTGAHLFINGACGPNGYIEVEVMDAWNNVWEGYSREDCVTFTGDSVRNQIRWSGTDSINNIIGSVKLRFYLRNAELYGFQFGDS